MAFVGAQAALAKAVEVYNEVIKLSGVVTQIESRVTDFRDEARKRLADFEQRIENRLNAAEARTDARFAALEARLLAAETALAKLEGKTAGALAEAYAVVLQDALGKRNGAPPALPNGS